MKLIVGRAKRLPDAQRDFVLERFGEEARERIRTASLLSWLPAEIMASFNEALNGLGSEPAVEFWRDMMVTSLETPALRPLRGGALRMFGPSPAGLLKFGPHAFTLASRGCASVRFLSDVAPSDPAFVGACGLEVTQPAPSLPFSLVAPLFIGTPLSVTTLLGHEAETTATEHTSERMVVRLQWRAKAGDDGEVDTRAA